MHCLLFNDAHSRVWNEACKFYEKGNMIVDKYVNSTSSIFDVNRISSFKTSTNFSITSNPK